MIVSYRVIVIPIHDLLALYQRRVRACALHHRLRKKDRSRICLAIVTRRRLCPTGNGRLVVAVLCSLLLGGNQTEASKSCKPSTRSC